MNKLAAVKPSRSGRTGKDLLAFFLFIVLTVIMTYPVILHPASSIPGGLGDPLLNTWILAWDTRKFMQGDLWGLFNADIFYPSKHTLAYSEHMFSSAVFALPFMAFFKNPVLAYNILLLAGISLSGFGMYLLALYLTGDRLASFCAGAIYAFFPWRFAHLGHLQLEMAQWIPFAFLYLHKFAVSGRYRHLSLFTAFFILQCLSCGYYAVFLSFFVALFMVMEVCRRGLRDREFIFKLGLFLLISGVFILPFFYPYIKLKHEMGFTRTIGENIYFSADISSYLSAAAINRLYGNITREFFKPEGELFMGFTALALAAIGIMSPAGEKPRDGHSGTPPARTASSKIFFWIFAAVFAGSLAVVMIIMASGGISRILGVRVRGERLPRPLTLAVISGFMSLMMTGRFRAFIRGALSIFRSIFRQPERRFYFIVLVLSVLFTFGPVIHIYDKEAFYGPYMLLYKFFPGFSGLRVPSRFIIMAAAALSVFAAFGAARILDRFNGPMKKAAVAAVLSAMILLESASMPVPAPSIATGGEIPEVYKWLGSHKGDSAVLELPMGDIYNDVKYVYFSTYHWKPLVNGYSGYFPPAYDFLVKSGMKDFPDDLSVGILRELNVRHLIIHSGNYGQARWESIKAGLKNYEPALKPLKEFGEAYVYENMAWADGDNPESLRVKIPRDGWIARAGSGDPRAALDNDLKTYWATGHPQRPGDFFEVDMGAARRISGISLELGPEFFNYPRGYKVEVSQDGAGWETVKEEKRSIPPLRSYFESPKQTVFNISFPPAQARMVRITQTGKSADSWWWSISEIHFLE